MEEKMDLRVRKTYLALHHAFDAALAEKRFEDLTVNELCDRAMIRRTTFYKHFADKYEYFAFYVREMAEAFQDRLAPDVGEGGADTYLMHMCQELLQFIQQRHKLVQNIKNSSVFPLLLSILVDQVSADVAQVLRRSNRSGAVDRMRLDGVAAFYAGGLANTLFQMLKTDSAIDEEEFLQITSKFLPALS